MSDRATRVAGSVLVAVATAVVLVALAIVPFLNPVWIAFGQDRAEAQAWTGYTPEQLRTATDGILADLVLGPPDFDVVVAGEPVLTQAERGHMRDVRGVFALGIVLAVAAAVMVASGARVLRPASVFWRAVLGGAVGVGSAVVVLGVLGLVAFDALFELFHRVFFPGGNYSFDASTSRLVQLFPQRFWFETSIAVGLVILVLALATAWLATRRLRSEVASTDAPAHASLEAVR